MSVLKIKDQNGNWQDIPAIKGADGAIQYRAGTNIQINNNTISTSGLNQTQVQDLIDASIEALGELGFTPTVVEELPSEDIDTHTIYLVPKQDSEQEDAYDEWLYINNAWEHIGSTTIDLSNYYTKSEGKIIPSLENIEIRLGNSNANVNGTLDTGVYIMNGNNWSIVYGMSGYRFTPGGNDGQKKILIISNMNSQDQYAIVIDATVGGIELINIDYEVTYKKIGKLSRIDATQTITGTWTYNTLPRSSVTPTTNNQLVNKSYVDNKTWIGTQSEYDAITTPNENTLYFIKEDTNAS